MSACHGVSPRAGKTKVCSMKMLILLGFSGILSLALWQHSGCSGWEHSHAGEAAVKAFYNRQTDSLIDRLNLLMDAAISKKPLPVLQEHFKAARHRYKQIEAIAEFYFPGLIRRINGPALPDVRAEEGLVWPPHGFQVIEQILYGAYDDSLQKILVTEVKLLQNDLAFIQQNLAPQTISATHMSELLQHQFIRIAAIGITGADAPMSAHSLPEAASALIGIREIAAAYSHGGDEPEAPLAQRTIDYLHAHSDFDAFDRLAFMLDYLVPLSDAYARSIPVPLPADDIITRPFTGSLRSLLRGSGFKADYYASYAIARSNPAKVALGKKLFAETRLSGSGGISCASCHDPERNFIDGQTKAVDFVHGGSLPRNTPTLLYAALQSHQFFDMRAVSLEDQAAAVMNDTSEFNFSPALIAEVLGKDSAYRILFRRAFGNDGNSLSDFAVRNALAAYVRSLSPFASPFDAYLRGNKSALSLEQVAGFNLFAGKAKCATCHFVPLFNGNVPPMFTKSEWEIIGVPARPVWEGAVIDADEGRFGVRPIPEMRFAFKTPTVRNVAKTAPYMHNGVYNTLDEVVKFYNLGGGAGLGIDLSSQTLPFDSLSLSAAEQKAIVRFMEALTDERNEKMKE